MAPAQSPEQRLLSQPRSPVTTRDQHTKSPLAALLLLVALSPTPAKSTRFPRASRATRSPPSPFSSIHTCHAPSPAQVCFSPPLPSRLSRGCQITRFLALPFCPAKVPAIHPQPHFPSIASPKLRPPHQKSPCSSPKVSTDPFPFSSPSPDRPIALSAHPRSRFPFLPSFPGATWRSNKVEPVTASPRPLRSSSH